MSKKILVTGGNGLIGHHFLQYVLDTTDWEVVALYRNNTERLPKSDRVECIRVDLSQEIDLDVGKLDYIIDINDVNYNEYINKYKK